MLTLEKNHLIYHNKTSGKFKIGIEYKIFGYNYWNEWAVGLAGKPIEYTAHNDALEAIKKLDNQDKWVVY